MGKKRDKKRDKSEDKKKEKEARDTTAALDGPDADAGSEPLSGKDYERELRKLHVELVKLQEWVKRKGLKICVLSRAGTVPARAARSRRSPSE